jgi:3-methylcrotonyl-CoA carboxylase alpha subunit
MIRRVLVANRGEIARRVMRTCRQMGIQSVAVYSDADRDAPHVHAADHALRVGPAAALESYLSIPAILEAARRSGADAVHPGYGFLSENADFARACLDAGLVWIGPTPDVIRRLGSKTAAREAAAAAGVPIVPGALAAAQDDASLAEAVRQVGLPALLKAAAGGGGRGMRTVRAATEVDEAIGAARREASRAFGHGDLYVERLIEPARHVEVQVMGDAHGRLVHLFERDCSLQRRHQKIVEEAPAWHLAAPVRAGLTDAALRVAGRVGYTNAGTVEFLVEGTGENARFYFLEMNTRLQVEHPVTEMVTGIDLVRLQLLAADGQHLPITQEDVRVRGHAVECRVSAEDSRRLLPQSGRLIRYREPSGTGIRVDSGVMEGQTIGVDYDSLLAKVIARGDTREEALTKIDLALAAFEILGLRHNVGFLRRLLAAPPVSAGRTYTGLVERILPDLVAPPSRDTLQAAAALAARLAAVEPGREPTADDDARPPDPWDALGPVRW